MLVFIYKKEKISANKITTYKDSANNTFVIMIVY